MKIPIVSQRLILKYRKIKFYKISIVNKSLLKAAMCFFFDIWGSLIEVSGSSLIIEQSSQFKNITNDWRENSMI